MSVITDYIFKHSFYREVVDTYNSVIDKDAEAYKLWLSEKSVSVSDDYEFKKYIYENSAEIDRLQGYIHTTKELLVQSKKAVAWFFHDRFNLSSIPALRSLEYKAIADNVKKINEYADYIKEYNSLLVSDKQAIRRFLQNGNHLEITHSFEEIRKIVDAKEQIKAFSEILKNAQTCKSKYPLMWKAFSKGRAISKIPMKELELVDSEVFAKKEDFLVVYTTHKTLCNLVLGIEDYNPTVFSEKAYTREQDCIKYVESEFDFNTMLNAVVHIDGNEQKRAILDSTRYGIDVNFNDEFTISQFYKIRKEADELNLDFDDIISKIRNNHDAVEAFNKEKTGKEIVYIEDYILASTKNSPLYNYIEAYKTQKEARDKASELAANYSLGFEQIFGSNIDFLSCEFSLVQKILEDESRIKNLDYIERENRRKREEEERKRIEEERKAAYIRELRNCVSHWCSLYSAYGVLHYNYLIPYYPTTCEFEATQSEWENRWLIWNFKNDPKKTSPVKHEDALSKIIPRMTRMLKDTFGTYLSQLTLVCISASSQSANEARFHDFSQKLAAETGMSNAYPYIQITKDATPKHLGGTGMPTLQFDENYFKGRYILLFDDVITRGKSMIRFKTKLESLGASVIAGFSIGRTKHER